MQCHAVVPSLGREDVEFFISCKDIEIVGREVFLSAYRSHVGVRNWVSTRVCGLCFVPWFRISLLSTDFHWTIDSCSDLTSSGVPLSWFSLVLTGVIEQRGHIVDGNWTLVLSDIAQCEWTGLGIRRHESLYRNRLQDSFCARKGALESGRRDVIRTREFNDQVFNAACSSQVWTLGQACRRFLVTGSLGLLCFFFFGGPLKNKWWQWGCGLKLVLKEVNTITYPPKNVNWVTEQQMYQVSGGWYDRQCKLPCI